MIEFQRVFYNPHNTFKKLYFSGFIDYTIDKLKNYSWSTYNLICETLANIRFNNSQMVCTKTLYNYIDLGLFNIKNTDLN